MRSTHKAFGHAADGTRTHGPSAWQAVRGGPISSVYTGSPHERMPSACIRLPGIRTPNGHPAWASRCGRYELDVASSGPAQLAELLRSRAPGRLEVRRVPARRPRSGFVRALKEGEQERLRVGRRADRLVWQHRERAIP